MGKDVYRWGTDLISQFLEFTLKIPQKPFKFKSELNVHSLLTDFLFVWKISLMYFFFVFLWYWASGTWAAGICTRILILSLESCEKCDLPSLVNIFMLDSIRVGNIFFGFSNFKLNNTKQLQSRVAKYRNEWYIIRYKIPMFSSVGPFFEEGGGGLENFGQKLKFLGFFIWGCP